MNIVKDLNSNVKAEIALNVQTIVANATTVGNIIDRGNYDAVEFTVFTGVRTDGSYAIQLFEDDAPAMGTEAQVTDANSFVGGVPGSLAASNGIAKFGYRGRKQFIRVKIVSTAVTTGCTGVGSISQKFGAGAVPAGGIP